MGGAVSARKGQRRRPGQVLGANLTRAAPRRRVHSQRQQRALIRRGAQRGRERGAQVLAVDGVGGGER